MNEAGESGEAKGRITMVLERAKRRAPIVPEGVLRAFVTAREALAAELRSKYGWTVNLPAEGEAVELE